MKALIMAAGRGTRISRHINDKPKWSVDIGGITLIENTIKQLISHGVKDIAIVLGYRQDVIKEILKDYDVKFYTNPFYDVTNSIASLWFAKEFLNGDDIMLLNGDVFCEDRLLELVLNEKQSPVLFSDETRKEEADYKFYYEEGKLIKYGKELTGNDITGEYVGIARFGKDFLSVFLERLEKLIDGQKHGLWWENILYSLTDEMNIYVRDVEKLFWAEVDYIEDYNRIIKFRGLQLNFEEVAATNKGN